MRKIKGLVLGLWCIIVLPIILAVIFAAFTVIGVYMARG
jgi:hypothetical protein